MSRSLTILSLTVAVILSAIVTEDAEARGRRHRRRCCGNYGDDCCASGWSGHGHGYGGCQSGCGTGDGCGTSGCGVGGCAIGGYPGSHGQVGYSGSGTSYYRGNMADPNASTTYPGSLNYDPSQNLNNNQNQIQNRGINGRDSSGRIQNNTRIDTGNNGVNSNTRTDAEVRSNLNPNDGANNADARANSNTDINTAEPAPPTPTVTEDAPADLPPAGEAPPAPQN